MKGSVIKRLAALGIMVLGLLLGVLAPAGGTTNSWRIVGLMLLIIGVVWLIRQPKPAAPTAADEPYERPPELQWYQSPILWVPVIIVILGVLTLILN